MPIYKTVQGHNCIDYELDTHDISEVNMLFIAEKKNQTSQPCSITGGYQLFITAFQGFFQKPIGDSQDLLSVSKQLTIAVAWLQTKFTT